MSLIFDCAVVGNGPAGLSAAINLRQRGKTVRVLGAGQGYLVKAEQIDNYLGLPGLTGAQMLDAFAHHAQVLGITPEAGKVSNILPMGDKFMLNFSGDILEARSIILACGAAKAKPVPGEAEFLGRGVSYCATCDGMLYKGRNVAVWGLAGEAPAEANFLASIGCTVTYIAAKRPADLEQTIRFVAGTVKAVGGSQTVEWVQVGQQQLECQGVFMLRAAIAPNNLLPGITLENGFVVTDRRQATNLPGVFAAGDITGTPLQVANAVGEGLVAALSAAEYLDTL